MKFIPSTRNAVSFGSSKLRGALHTSANFGVAANCHPFFANIFVRSACRGGKAASKFTELGDGRKSRALFAKPGRYTARIPILDEPSNHFDVGGNRCAREGDERVRGQDDADRAWHAPDISGGDEDLDLAISTRLSCIVAMQLIGVRLQHQPLVEWSKIVTNTYCLV